ncbi:YdgA family protein [Parendozoicomonas haliclonae]|uniref:YdgA family protein n=1 Tax=Parendozoicomonas haliclonae TaxID=1960125 RepID=A0A1X7AFM7_9GAMM|nr:DUF945 family protein [Parendozoicomonas haliclonae]SMA38091.1 hypothetical protein EHSB41UT_00824 [Parendozoicomonas haliclonae]
MKKVVLASSVIVLAGVLGTPGLVGSLAKDRFDETFAKLSTPDIRIEWESYEKSWFSSKGVVNTHINLPLDPTKPPLKLDLKYQVTMNHGPVILGDGLQFGWASWNSDMTNAGELMADWPVEEMPAITQTGLINLLGDIHFQDTVSAFVLKDDEDRANIGAFTGTGMLSGENFAYEGGVEEIKVMAKKAGQDLILKKLAVTMNGIMPSDYTYGDMMPGHFGFTVDGLYAGDEYLFDKLGVFADVTLNEQKDAGDITVTYSADRVQTPELMLTHAKVEASLRNYSVEFNRAYTLALQEYMRDGGDLAKAEEQMLMVLTESFDKLMAGKPELDIANITFTLPEGTFASSANLKLDNYDITLQQLMDQHFLRSNMNFSASASADELLAKKLALIAVESQAQGQPVDEMQVEMMLGMMTATGMVTLKDNKYVSEISMKNGSAVVNGQPVPLPGA